MNCQTFVVAPHLKTGQNANPLKFLTLALSLVYGVAVSV
jgi:hypothetical protein